MTQSMVSALIGSIGPNSVGNYRQPSSTFLVVQLPLQNLKLSASKLRSFEVHAFDLKGTQGRGKLYEIELKVRDYELDQYGVVNHATYASFANIFDLFSINATGRHELLESIGISDHEVARTGDALTVTELSIKYLAPLRSGDRFVVKMRVSDCTAAHFFFEHFIFKLPDQEPILEARGTAVWLNKSYRPVRIPSEVRSKFLPFLPQEASK